MAETWVEMWTNVQHFTGRSEKTFRGGGENTFPFFPGVLHVTSQTHWRTGNSRKQHEQRCLGIPLSNLTLSEKCLITARTQADGKSIKASASSTHSIKLTGEQISVSTPVLCFHHCRLKLEPINTCNYCRVI